MSQPGQNFDKNIFGNIRGAILCSTSKSTKIGTGQN